MNALCIKYLHVRIKIRLWEKDLAWYEYKACHFINFQKKRRNIVPCIFQTVFFYYSRKVDSKWMDACAYTFDSSQCFWNSTILCKDFHYGTTFKHFIFRSPSNFPHSFHFFHFHFRSISFSGLYYFWTISVARLKLMLLNACSWQQRAFSCTQFSIAFVFSYLNSGTVCYIVTWLNVAAVFFFLLFVAIINFQLNDAWFQQHDTVLTLQPKE